MTVSQSLLYVLARCGESRGPVLRPGSEAPPSRQRAGRDEAPTGGRCTGVPYVCLLLINKSTL